MKNNAEEISLDDDDFLITGISDDKEKNISEKKEEFIRICQKDQCSEEDFARLEELSSVIIGIPDKHPDVVNFAYYAIDKAMELNDQQSIKDAISFSDRIFTRNYNAQHYRPDEDSPISINKFRSNVDDLLYAHFSDHEHNFNPEKYINPKLYPQANVKVQAFRSLEFERNKQSSSVETHKEASSAIESYSSTPNQGQFKRIIRDLGFLSPTEEADRIIQEMTPVKQSLDQNLLTGSKNYQKAKDDKLYQTDLSKYSGKSNAEIAMGFSDYYQWTSLAMGLPSEEALQQTPESIILSLHKHREVSDPLYREIPDTIQETITNIPSRARNAIADFFTPNLEAVIPQSIGDGTFSKDSSVIDGNNNVINSPGYKNKINSPSGKLSTTSQLALGAVIIGAAVMGAKKVYNLYKQNFGEDASLESIKEAKSLLSQIIKSDQDFSKIYDGLTSRHNKIAEELNNLYDSKQQNTNLYKRTRDELDHVSQKREEAYDLENRVIQIKEDFRNLDAPNLKAKYVESLIKEYHDITEGYDKLIIEKSIHEIKQKESLKKNSENSAESPRGHAEKILEERKEQKSSVHRER